ncbi:GNAT family N-acetyltransferase [Vibrio sp. SCSIO 43140]|uniref:GNAT family N-acetyltransferase n=1 Tax=Vibrio sp. SCSIO 43140 TaxID=2819100 RepID=UPI002075786A|nr:GNAT family N-acetyltransferase [Vibrio sp. SCSIO 43140]
MKMNFDFYVGTIDDALTVDDSIPEFVQKTPKEKLIERLKDKKHLVLIAAHNNKPIAYKIGYELSKSEFYSWLGGVSIDYRKLGIATELREQQEAWALEQGYRAINVKSMNRFPAMLQLLLSSGYKISGYEDNGSVDNSKIHFAKQLGDK